MKKIFVVLLVALLCVSFADFALAQRGKAKGEAIPAGERIVPTKVEVDTDGDGKPDRSESYDKAGVITGIESDTNNDGKIDEWLYYEKGKLTKAAKDTSGDGKQDTWISY